MFLHLEYKACGFCVNVHCVNRSDVDSKSIKSIVEHFRVIEIVEHFRVLGF
jgi:hypothetical protein